MDRLIIPRDDTRKDNIDPTPAWGFDAGGSLFIRCACGLCLNIDHYTNINGDVTPSILHDPSEGGWHEWVTLEDFPN